MSSRILSHILGQNMNQLPHNRTDHQENLTIAVLKFIFMDKKSICIYLRLIKFNVLLLELKQ